MNWVNKFYCYVCKLITDHVPNGKKWMCMRCRTNREVQ